MHPLVSLVLKHTELERYLPLLQTECYSPHTVELCASFAMFMLTLLLISSIVFPSFFLFSHLNSLWFQPPRQGSFQAFLLDNGHGFIQGGVERGWAPKISMILRKWTGETADSGTLRVPNTPLTLLGHGEICHPDCPAIQVVYY